MKSARFWSAFLGTLMLFVDANTNDANAADTTHKVHGTPMHLLGLHPPFIGSDLKDENWDFGGMQSCVFHRFMLLPPISMFHQSLYY
jgi:hypothetical protein